MQLIVLIGALLAVSVCGTAPHRRDGHPYSGGYHEDGMARMG
jgi:hypothetical protein